MHHNTGPCSNAEITPGRPSYFLTKGCDSNISAEGRRAASFCKHKMMKLRNSGEASGGGAGGSPKHMAYIKVGQSGFSPGCKQGKRPMAHSRSVKPRLQISAAYPYSPPLPSGSNRSGLIYAQVPTNELHCASVFANTVLTPKSAIFTSCLRLSNKLEGLISRWTILCLWR